MDLPTLTAFASSFTLAQEPGESPLEPVLKVNPPPELVGRKGLVVREIVQEVTQVELPTDVDLAFVAKWVRSANSDLPVDPALEDPIGGMPVSEQLVTNLGLTPTLSTNLPPSSLMTSDTGQSATAGVPELLGRVTGTVIHTVERVSEAAQASPVTVALRWRIFDESGGTPVEATNVRYRTTDPPTPPAPRDFDPLPDPLVVPSGLPSGAGTPLVLYLQLPATFSELRSATPDVVRLSVRCAVRLTMTPPAPASPLTTGFVELPPLPLVVPTILVPTILVLCEHQDFGGRKLVLVPPDSLVGAVAGMGVGQALALTSSMLTSLLPAHSLLGFLASAAPTAPLQAAANVLTSLSASPGQTIVAALSRIENLSAEQFVFEPGGWFGGRFTGEDMASSLICIGRPGAVFDFFQDRNLVERISRLQITLGEALGCAIRKLDRLDPTQDVVYPAGTPAGVVTAHSPVWPHEDRISSLAFSGPSKRFIPFSV